MSQSYDPNKGIALICGNGDLPGQVALQLKRDGRLPVLFGISGEAGENITDHEHTMLKWGQVGALLKHLSAHNITQVVFCGGIKNRPKLSQLGLDWWTVKSLPKVMAALIGGDNSVLTATIKLFAEEGINVVGAHEVVPALLSGEGLLAGPKLSKGSKENLELAKQGCWKLGDLDAGQACVCENRRLVALEAAEGTDAMLERVMHLREIGRLHKNTKNGVLVKLCKPEQDMRADLPTIGPNTIDKVASAGLTCIGVDAGKSFILHRDQTLERAYKRRITVVGLAT